MNPIREWIPGEKIVSYAEYIGFIQTVIERKDVARKQRQKLMNRLHDFQDDQSSWRIIQAFNL